MLNEPRKPIKILVVDDQELVRLGLTVTLNRVEGMVVVGESRDGKTAVQKCSELKPDIVLMDLAMPVMNGIEATHAIKTTQPEIRVIMLTTHESDEDVFAALGAGADAYCIKTIGTKELCLVLETVAHGATWLDPAIAGRVLSALQKAPRKGVGEPADLVVDLSPRELEVLELVMKGLTNPQMAERLVLSPETIKSHMRHIMEKLAVTDRTQAAVKALKMGLIAPP